MSSSLLTYENKLKCLLKCKGTTIPQVVALLEEAIIHSGNIKSLRYLRLWLYLAAFSEHPLPIYQYLLDNYIGYTHALLYQDVSYYYSNTNKDKAMDILIRGIDLNAQPMVDLRRSIWNLERGIHYTAPPSMTKISVTVPHQRQIPLFMAGLGSSGIHGVLDAMELYIHKTARIALLFEGEHGHYSCEELRAISFYAKQSAAFEHEPRPTLEQSQKITPRRTLQPTSKQDQNTGGNQQQHDQKNKRKQRQRQSDLPQVAYHKLQRPLQALDDNHGEDTVFVWRDGDSINQEDDEATNYDANRQPQDEDRHSQRTIVTTPRPTVYNFTFPLSFAIKQSLVVPQVIEATTYDLVQSYEPNCLDILKRKRRARTSKKEKMLMLNHQKVQCLELLGSGRYGSVYQISWNDQLMAMKMQLHADRWDHYMLQFIHQQCPDATRFIIRSHALYINQKSSFMIRDYLSHGTFWDFIIILEENNIKTMSEPLVQLLILRLLQGVVMLHSAHIIHMDIKLDNIMMDYSIVDSSAPVATNYLNKKPPPYTPSDPYWNKISMKLVDFGLAINLNLLSPDTLPRPIFMASAAWTGTAKVDMPAIASDSKWPPHHKDYWGIANCAHRLLFGSDITYGLPNRSKRNWNGLFWTRFYKALVTSPAPDLEDGTRDLISLIADLELSLKDEKVANEAVHQLQLYDRYRNKK